MEISIDPSVIGVICVITVGSLVTLLLTTVCCVCNKCCRDGKSRCSIYYKPQVLPDVPISTSAVAVTGVPQNGDVEHGSEERTLKDSVLLGDAPPTYQTAKDYPTVYAGQYYIGMCDTEDMFTTVQCQ